MPHRIFCYKLNDICVIEQSSVRIIYTDLFSLFSITEVGNLIYNK